MAVVQAGLAFRSATPPRDLALALGRIVDGPVREIGLPAPGDFDIRRREDLMLQCFGEVCFLGNFELAGAMMDASANGAARRFHEGLGQPETLFAYCHDELAERFGYCLASAGRRVRVRLQVPEDGEDAGPGAGRLLVARHAVSERGPAQAFERRWLGAAHFKEYPAGPGGPALRVFYVGAREILVAERDLTARLLRDGLEALFGVCPWDTLMTPTYRFFRAGAPAEPVAPGAGAARDARRGWRWWR